MPPIALNETNGKIKPRLTLPNLKYDIPDTKETKNSEVWTLALAITGDILMEISKTEELTPYPIPSVPSIICARKPIMLISTKLFISPPSSTRNL